jgi:hypothetical protein
MIYLYYLISNFLIVNVIRNIINFFHVVLGMRILLNLRLLACRICSMLGRLCLGIIGLGVGGLFGLGR